MTSAGDETRVLLPSDHSGRGVQLPPVIHPRVSDFLSSHQLAPHRLVDLFGSPLHVVFPEIMIENARVFRGTLNAQGFDRGRIYFAVKANKANAFLAASAVAHVGADVSSVQEFAAALASGIAGQDISISGPSKTGDLVALSLLHDARIVVDQPSELETILDLASRLGVTRAVRVSFRLAPPGANSRFGMSEDLVARALSVVRGAEGKIELDGFAFHVSGYDTRDRERMITHACGALQRATGDRLTPSRIDIGGGLLTPYADPDTWDVERLGPHDFANDEFPQFVYPYAERPAGAQQLADILCSSKRELDAAARALERPVIIDLEPGRSLLDQTGITIFRIQGVRPLERGWVIVVEGNSRHLSEFWFESEFLTDPLFLPVSASSPEPFAAAVAANTCMEDDYLARRFIPFPSRPREGDLLVYVNTAGYQMDSMESEFHRLPLPRKVAAIKSHGSWRLIDDERLNVTHLLGKHA
jgi:diaminopimelate decarboxylase